MTAKISLQKLMEQESDPKYIETRQKYSNAQIAVDIAYRVAIKHYYSPEKKELNPDWKEGDNAYDKYKYTDASNQERVTGLCEMARLLKIEIEKDLNDTLKVLEGANGAESTTA